MKAHEESWGWEREQHFPSEERATGGSSRRLQGQWKRSCQWERESNNWDHFSSDDGVFPEEFENIMQWDDSGAREAFQIARERYEAGLRGLMYPVSLPDPDLYIQTVNWDTHETFDLPESADVLSSGEGRKRQRRRNPKGGRFQGDRKGIGKSGRPYHLESGNGRQINNEIGPHSTHWQADVRQSGLDYPMPDVNGSSTMPQQDRLVSRWGEGQPSPLQLQWQDRQTGHFDWQVNPQTQPSYKGCLGSNISSGQAALPSGWIYGNDIIQAPVNMQTGCSADCHQTSSNPFAHRTSGMNNVYPGNWMVQCQMDGQNMAHHSSRFGHGLQENRGPGNSLRESASLFDRTRRWGQPKWQRHHDRC